MQPDEQSAEGRHHLETEVSWQHVPNIHALSSCLPHDGELWEQDKIKSLRDIYIYIFFFLPHFVFPQLLHMLLFNFCGSGFAPLKDLKALPVLG